MKVPFNNLALQYSTIQQSIDDAIKGTLAEFNFIKGSRVQEFEEGFAGLLKVRHCIATGNGTDALFISLKALGIGPGDEVITPAFSWISSAETISLCGAKPIFADIHRDTYTLDPLAIESRITPQTKAVIAVHLYGQAAHMEAIVKVCKEHNLLLVEDCAQAHLTMDSNQYAGTFGDAAAFSFYPTKNLGAYGDAGCIITNHDHLADRIRRLSNHGALEKDDHLMEGLNSRMDTVQAAILSAKLPHLKGWNSKRSQHASEYSEQLRMVREISVPIVRAGTTHPFHLYVIRAQRRNELKDFLQEKEIQTIIHYPRALHNLPAYQYLQHHPSDFPVSSQLQEEVLSLPVYPELTPGQIAYVCENIKEFYQK
jgi:dTDP-4-amino-4,6-dideoxygalactose transaminase